MSIIPHTQIHSHKYIIPEGKEDNCTAEELIASQMSNKDNEEMSPVEKFDVHIKRKNKEDFHAPSQEYKKRKIQINLPCNTHGSQENVLMNKKSLKVDDDNKIGNNRKTVYCMKSLDKNQTIFTTFAVKNNQRVTFNPQAKLLQESGKSSVNVSIK